MAQTLEELKAANAAEDAEAAQTDENESVDELDTEAPQATEDEPETETAEDESPATDEDAESSDDKGDETDVEDWMKGDGHESQAEKTFTGEDIGIAKARLRAKLTKKLDAKDSELEQAKARIRELETKPTTAPSGLQKPKRDDFFESDDPDQAYDDALTEYIIGKGQATTAAATAADQQKRVQQENAAKIAQGEDKHYERAAKLVEQSGISESAYQSADSLFRQAIDNAAQGAGDAIAAAFMAKLGNGSEKVVFNIGVNSEKREKLTRLLREDPSGLDGYGYLVELKAELNSPTKRKTNAPKPAPSIRGDKVENSSLKAIKKQYQSEKDPQKRFNLRLQAKAGGAKDVNDW